MVHGWLGVLDEKPQHWHEVAIAIVDYFYLNGGHLCHDFCLRLDLLDYVFEDPHNVSIWNLIFLKLYNRNFLSFGVTLEFC